MRFRSAPHHGFQVFAVSGTNTITFVVTATAEARKGLQGFAVERIDPDPKKPERFYLKSTKVFPSVIHHPDPTLSVTTFEHPVQDLFWSDYTAKDDHAYEYIIHPLRGTPKNLDRSAATIAIKVRTEKLFSDQTHDVFFNRGVASSQAYVRRFGNKKPEALRAEGREQEALNWLSRDLDDAVLRFINEAKKGDTLLGCFYEFRYEPVAAAFKAASKRGVQVRIIVDAKVNEHTDDDGFHASFPREENLAMIKKVKLPAAGVILREARPAAIHHNKFIVHLRGKSAKPVQTWTGSTNISAGGIHGQTNVGHWVRDEATAARFQAYWNVLAADPGAHKGDDSATVRKANGEFRKGVEELTVVPDDLASIPKGITCVFSPRRGKKPLELYMNLVDEAKAASCITLAFGINKQFKSLFRDNLPATSPFIMLLLEQQDKPKPPRANATKPPEPFVAINASHNVYQAWGAFLGDAVYQFARETNTRKLQLNQHVSYIHSKFLLRDPLSEDPIIVTGSANFSDASTTENDENMIIIRGDTRVADIYFTEFNRLFYHYFFRSVAEAASKRHHESTGSAFLTEHGEWLAAYAPGKMKAKRLALLAGMKGFAS